jgi:hypothetical protein
VSLKGRIRSLDARVEWLQDWGELRRLAQKMRYLAAKKKIIERAPEVAVRLGLMPPKPVPPPKTPPRPEREGPRRERLPRSDVLPVNSLRPPESHKTMPASGCVADPAPREAARAPGDAPLHDAPPAGIVPRSPSGASSPAEQPPGQHLPGQPAVPTFVPIQNGMIRWRQRGPEDDWEDDGSLEDEDYDPLAAES